VFLFGLQLARQGQFSRRTRRFPADASVEATPGYVKRTARRAISRSLAAAAVFPAWTAPRVSAMISRMGTAPKFVVGTSGRREAVLLDMNQYRRMLQKLEDLEDALALDRAERTSKKLVPYEAVRRRLKRAGKL